jgi:hypothetical protein
MSNQKNHQDSYRHNSDNNSWHNMDNRGSDHQHDDKNCKCDEHNYNHQWHDDCCSSDHHHDDEKHKWDKHEHDHQRHDDCCSSDHHHDDEEHKWDKHEHDHQRHDDCCSSDHHHDDEKHKWDKHEHDHQWHDDKKYKCDHKHNHAHHGKKHKRCYDLYPGSPCCDDRFAVRLAGLEGGLNFRLRQLIGDKVKLFVNAPENTVISGTIVEVGGDFIELKPTGLLNNLVTTLVPFENIAKLVVQNRKKKNMKH